MFIHEAFTYIIVFLRLLVAIYETSNTRYMKSSGTTEFSLSYIKYIFEPKISSSKIPPRSVKITINAHDNWIC